MGCNTVDAVVVWRAGDIIGLDMWAIPIAIVLETWREAGCSILGEVLASISGSLLREGLNLSLVLDWRSYVASILTLRLRLISESSFCFRYSYLFSSSSTLFSLP